MKQDYQAYLIRFQRGKGQAHWRAMLEDASSGEKLRFATELDLLRYVLKNLAEENLDLPENAQDKIRIKE